MYFSELDKDERQGKDNPASVVDKSSFINQHNCGSCDESHNNGAQSVHHRFHKFTVFIFVVVI